MNKALVARAEPTLRKYKLPVVLENHKGWRAAEQAAWLKGLGPKKPIRGTAGLSPADQLKFEDENNHLSIEWAHANLDM